MKRKYLLVLLSLAIVVLMATSTISAVSAATLDKEINGKGAIAQWSITGPGGAHVINAIVDMSNSGKEGKIYVSIVHPLKTGISVASGPANFKWSMNHVTVEAALTFDGPAGRTGTHNIIISWQTDGSTSNKPLTADTGNGLEGEINGAWKSGVAELSIRDDSGHHIASDFASSWAIVVHGTADISLTTP